MFLKIRMRSVLLSIFENCGFETNPYSLDPLTHYIYYDSLNNWLKFMKEAKELSLEEKVDMLIQYTLAGYDPEKLYAQTKIGDGSYSLIGFINEQLLDEIESISSEDARAKLIVEAIKY